MPKFLASDFTDQTHALTISDPDNPLQPVILLLGLKGVRLPVIINEFSSEEFPWLHLTSETKTWDPLTNLYEDQEKVMTDYYGSIVRDAAVRGPALTLFTNKLNSLTTDTLDIHARLHFPSDLRCKRPYLKHQCKPE